MEIQVKRLRDTLELLAPLTPRKSTLKSLSYVLLKDGQAVATDLEVGVAVELPEADGEGVLLPAKDALGFLKYTRGTAMAQVTATRNKVTIAASGMETSFSDVPDVDDFPPLPRVKGESEGVLNGDALVRTLVALAPYAAIETTRPVLNGVCLTTGDELEVVAADGFRLIWEGIPGKLSGPSMIIPHKGVDILEHLWKRAAAPDLTNVRDLASLAVAPRLIRLGWGQYLLSLNFDAVTLIIQLIQGSFPDYRRLIPTETQPLVTVMAEDMARVLAQVAPVAKDVKGIVRLRWEGGGLQVSVKGEEKEASVPVPAQFTEPGKTALNINYLREYFKGRSGVVSMSTATPQSPVLFTYRGKAHVLLMPMFVEWEPKSAVVAQAEQVAEEAQAEEAEEEEVAEQSETEAEEEPKRGRKKRN